VDRRRGKYFVQATVFAYAEEQLSSQEIDHLQAELSRAVGGPVEVNLTVIPAYGSDLVRAADLRALEEFLQAAVNEADVSIAELVAEQRPDDVYVFATLVTYAESSLSQSLLTEWQTEMTELAGRPVVLDVTAIEGQRGNYESTSVPAPSIVATATVEP
jgi:hypothetical protein